MTRFFNPAIGLMNRLKYPQKFTLISVLFSLPLLLVLFLLISDISSQAEATQFELTGTRYLRPLRQFFADVLQSEPQVQDSLAASGDRGVHLPETEAKIDADLSALTAVDADLGPLLHTPAQFQALESNWGNLKQKIRQRDPGSAAVYTRLIAAIRALNAQVGDTSNLILDPQLNSYYLVDSVLLKLPEGQDLLAQTGWLGHSVLTGGQLTAETRAQLITLTGLAQANQEATGTGLGVAFRSDPGGGLKPRLEPALIDSRIAVTTFLGLLDTQVIGAPAPTLPLATYESAAGQAVATRFLLWDQAIAELDGLLHARLTGYTQQQYLVVLVTLLVVLLLVYLWIAFYLAVVRTVARLDEAARRMVSGNMTTLVILDNRDELGQVATSFNRVIDTIRALVRQLQQEAEIISTRAQALRIAAESQAAVANEQTAAIERLGQGIENLGHAAQQIVVSAEAVTASATGTLRGVEQTHVAVADSSHQLRDIIQHLTESLSALGERSTEVSAVADTMRAIADETHLLALNATIEAAGAGAYGHRFAVVAQEVQSLAGQALNATDDFQTIAGNMRHAAHEALTTTQVSVQGTDRSMELVTRASTAIDSIAGLAQHTSDAVQAITGAVTSQQHTNLELAGFAEQVTRNARRTAEASTTLSTVAQDLTAVVLRLQESVDVFQIDR